MRAITPGNGAGYLVWIFSAWSAYVFGLYPSVARFSEPSSTIVNECIRFVVFATPALWLLCQGKSEFSKKDWAVSPAALRIGLPTALAFTLVASAVAAWGLHKVFRPTSIPIRFWFTSFSASTVIEELAFRAVLFCAFASWPRKFTIILSSAAFAAIHFPGWWASAAFASGAAWISNTASIFLLGCVTGVVYLKTRSIWATTFVHAANNFVAAAFV